MTSLKTRMETIELSAQEKVVLSLIAKGFTAKEIAKRLGIVPKTAESHTYNIYCKINVNRRAEAAIEAVRMGLA